MLLTPAAAFSQSRHASPAQTIGLGFGPTSIEPASAGVPVFTAGDELWAQSFYNTTTVGVFLMSPRGNFTPTVSLEPGNLADLYTFSAKDPTGMWTLYVSSFYSSFMETFRISVVNQSSVLEPTLATAGVVRNDLQLQYSLPPSAAYDIQACTAGTTMGPSTSFVLPSSVGGSMAVTLSGDTAVLAAPSARVPFVAWLELYAPRSYTNGTTLVSEQVMASQSGTLTLSNSTGPVTAELTNEMNMRVGRYDLRAFVRGPTGLVSFETPYLMETGPEWVSLGGCTQLADVASNPFTLTTSLDGPNSTWPRRMYLMYTVDGVDSFTLSQVPATAARIDVKTTLGLGLSGATMTLGGPGVKSWDAFGSSIYLVGNSFPLAAKVGIDFQGVASESFNVTVPSPSSYTSLRVDAGILNIQTTVRGTPLGNVALYVSEVGSSPASFTSGINASKSVMLPPGEYNVTAAFSGKSVSEQAQVVSGRTASLTLDSNPPQPPFLLYALAVVLVAGVAINYYAWRAYLVRKSTLT
jgi:hypothetical protein